MVAHQDGAKPTDSRFIPLLETAHGPIALRLPQGLPAKPGARIAVHDPKYSDGAIVGGNLAMLGPPTGPSSDPTVYGPADFTPGPRNVLVLLAQINGQPAPGSAAAVRNIIFTAPNSANAFIQEESFGQLSLTGKLRSDGDIYGPYMIQSKQKPDVCDNVGWGSDAEAQFAAGNRDEPRDLGQRDRRLPGARSATSRASARSAQLHVGTGARHAWINAVADERRADDERRRARARAQLRRRPRRRARVLRRRHAYLVQRGVRERSERSSTNQYLDPFDVMGSGLRQENAYHKWESGWLPSASVQTVVRSGTYLIAPEESSSERACSCSRCRAWSAGRATGSTSASRSGAGSTTSSRRDPEVNGVSIRYANSSTMPHPSKSWLIDTTPDTDTFADSALAVGRTYTDTLRGVSITTVAVSPLGALVKITIPNGADSTPPGYPGGLTASLVGHALHIAWTAASDDSGVVQHYRVRRNGVLLADVWDTSATDPSPLAGRTTDYDVSAVDPAGNEGPAARIEVSVADTTAPSAPTSLAASINGTGVNLSWSPAIDDVGDRLVRGRPRRPADRERVCTRRA